ncbi:MAG: LysE family transporter [Actinomycetota bacterium]|nr:LysE family transporter [Actinomycetota bacterium]
MEALLKGAVIGFSVAAPPGPNAALCMSRTLVGGRRAGLRCGLGAATAHAVYAVLAVLGVGRASGFLSTATGGIRLAGGLLLVGLGVRLALTPWSAERRSPTGAYATTLALGLVNPLTLLYFAAALALGVFPPGTGALVVAGVFAGSAAWWTALTSGVAAVGHRLDERRIVWINRLASAAIAGFGVLAVASAI